MPVIVQIQRDVIDNINMVGLLVTALTTTVLAVSTVMLANATSKSIRITIGMEEARNKRLFESVMKALISDVKNLFQYLERCLDPALDFYPTQLVVNLTFSLENQSRNVALVAGIDQAQYDELHDCLGLMGPHAQKLSQLNMTIMQWQSQLFQFKQGPNASSNAQHGRDVERSLISAKQNLALAARDAIKDFEPLLRSYGTETMLRRSSVLLSGAVGR